MMLRSEIIFKIVKISNNIYELLLAERKFLISNIVLDIIIRVTNIQFKMSCLLRISIMFLEISI